ncbi:C4-dicarboxylate ABC transporter [Vibrio cholerae]|nr:C4-dicarboxylate ABC transporter [Vibrio cholerae]
MQLLFLSLVLMRCQPLRRALGFWEDSPAFAWCIHLH